jgi:hypothetical protein
MKILAIVRRVLKEMLRDKRTLALMFLAPFHENGTFEFLCRMMAIVLLYLMKQMYRYRFLNRTYTCANVSSTNFNIDAYVFYF